MRSLAVVLVLALGCSSRPEHRDTTVGNTTPPASDAAPPAAGCPATLAAASASGACSGSDTCTYPDGVCYCAEPPWCGGMAPPPRPPVWNCTPNVRADGCPGNQPANGTACSPEGKTCDYSCSCAQTATCTHGTWINTTGPCVP